MFLDSSLDKVMMGLLGLKSIFVRGFNSIMMLTGGEFARKDPRLTK